MRRCEFVESEALRETLDVAVARLAGERGDARDKPAWLIAAAVYDVDAIRRDFPILAERPYGKELVYLDNAASAQKPQAVIERMSHFYEHEYANVHRGLHYLANAATEAFEGARETCGASSMPAPPTKSSLRAARRRRSISSPPLSVSRISARATRSSCP